MRTEKELREALCAYLDALGVAGAGEGVLPGAALCAVREEILHRCNLRALTPALEEVVLQRAAGRYLRWQAQAPGGLGRLTENGDADFAPVLERIQEGDTEIVYAAAGSGTDTALGRLHALAEALERAGEDVIAAHRRLRW